MEYEDDDEKGEGGFLQRLKESPRTVSALIIILIVAAAIYAFSGEQPQQGEQPTGEATPTEEAQATEQPQETGEFEEVVPEETAAAPAATPQVVEQRELQQQSRALPEARKTQEGYVEVAQTGDGITHLARRATTRYLSENRVAYSVTNEHRIYIEDYIKDQIGSRPLALGEELTITFDQVKEAVSAAEQLTDAQIQNLTKYSTVFAT